MYTVLEDIMLEKLKDADGLSNINYRKKDASYKIINLRYYTSNGKSTIIYAIQNVDDISDIIVGDPIWDEWAKREFPHIEERKKQFEPHFFKIVEKLIENNKEGGD